MDLQKLTISETLDGLREKKFSAAELLDSYLARTKEINPKINAYLEIWEEGAKKEALASDKKIAGGNIGQLEGIPIALKDNLLFQGHEVTSGSNILKGHISAYTATVVEKMKNAGAVFIGRANMDEFAMGTSNETSAFGPVKNPWDLDRVPGGSSGGPAAAVSADMCLGALGSDTGGSIRQPAALCGIVGLKPTYGRVSRFGLMSLASSLDQIGPFAKNVKDVARILEVIEGEDPKDSTSVPLIQTTVPDLLEGNIKGMKIGVPKEYFIDGMDSKVEQSVRTAIKKLEELGAQIKEVSLPYTDYGIAAYYILQPSEASANLARYDGVRYGNRLDGSKNLMDMYASTRGKGFGDEVRRRIMIGTYALSSGYYDAYYKKALEVRSLIAKDFQETFKDVDCLVTPTSPTTAFKLGEKFDDPIAMYLADVFTVAANIAGIPGISVPCGFVENEGKSLPVGLQFLGKQFDEAIILRAAYAYEQGTEWHNIKPEIIE